MIVGSGFEFPLRVPDIAFFFTSIFSFVGEGSRIFLLTVAFIGVVDFWLGVLCLS